MNNEEVIITVYAKDRLGIVKALSDVVLANNGNWLESSLSRLCGQFAGIVHIAVPADSKAELLKQFNELANDGILVTQQEAEISIDKNAHIESVDIVVEANDRTGIVEEIASALAQADVNVEQMITECESASMAGYELFRAQLRVALPESLSVEQLESVLENVSDDLMVSIVLED